MGRLTLAAEPEVAQELRLSETQQQKLQDYLAKRESAALNLAQKLRGVDPPERDSLVATFRKESEQGLLPLLEPAQQEKLHRRYWKSLGPVALADPLLQSRLTLSDQQKSELSSRLEERNDSLRSARGSHRQSLDATAQRDLLAILSDSQRTQWESIVPIVLAAEDETASKTTGTVQAEIALEAEEKGSGTNTTIQPETKAPPQ